MSIVVGIAPGHELRGPLQLGALIARSYGKPLVVAVVNSAAWPPNRSHGAVDREYQDFVAAEAQAALEEARGIVPDDLEVEYLVHRASSARRGLLELCEERDAMRLVVGAKGEGPEGEISLGSVVTGLLHGAHVPVAVAPRGYTVPASAGLERITVAYSGSETSGDLVLGAAAVAAEAGCGIRIASFHARPRAYASAAVGLDAEDAVIAEWEAVIREETEELLGDISRFDSRPASVSVAVGAGSGWHEALRAIDWKDAEVLLVGSSSLGPLARISLGSHAVKIMRHSPVPVVVVPRRATEDYVARAPLAD